MAMAEKLDGVIVNADAMQLYAELQVLTSRPSAADEARVTHVLYGTVPAREAWSAARWLEAAASAMDAIWMQGKVPVVAGGTGLYFKVLQEGLSPVPPVPAEVRQHWRERLKTDGANVLHGELMKVAPADAARLEPGDGQRIARALEVCEATGKPLGEHFASARAASVLADATVRKMALTPPRKELYGVCDVRFETMMARGALDEVKALLALGLRADVPAMKAIGVQALAAHLAGETTIEQAIALAQKQTRNYAKRQMTWIRNQMADWPRAETRAAAIEGLLHDNSH